MWLRYAKEREDVLDVLGNVNIDSGERERDQLVVTVERTTMVCFGGCVVLRREEEVQQIRVKGKVSYAHAVKMARQEKLVKEHSHNKGQRAEK